MSIKKPPEGGKIAQNTKKQQEFLPFLLLRPCYLTSKPASLAISRMDCLDTFFPL